jgi:ATP-dependent DNA helicase PIF1
MYSYLSKSQRLAADAIELGKNVFITGCAGSGKSYLLHYLKENIKNKYLQITATTGVAAINVGGVTLHSWANLGLEELPMGEIIKKIMSVKGINTRRKIQSTEVLAIDEISMLSKETFENLNTLLQAIRASSRPVGGIQLVMFGDFFQLPPVNSNNFCFESNLWKEAGIQTVCLKEVFRQEDERFVELLNNIRYGRIVKEDIELLKTRYNVKSSGVIRPTILSTHNSFVEKINYEYLNRLPAEEKVFEACYNGNRTKIDILKRNCIAKETLVLKVGCQVMMLKNTYQKDGIINGSVGVVVDFTNSRKSYPVVRFENGKELVIKSDVWEITSYNKKTQCLETDAEMVQIPLNLAWAMTVHKSQGMTIDKAECDLANSFAEGQVYVALSRVRNLEGLYIKSFDINKVKANRKILEFYEGVQF